MRHKLLSFFHLPPADRLGLLQAWLLLLGVDLGLRWLSFTRLQALLSRAANPHQPDNPAETVRRWLVDLAGRNHLYPMTCLRRALALQWLLARRGVQTRLRFGVKKEANELIAHAWLEREGIPVSEPELVTERYAALQPFLAAQTD